MKNYGALLDIIHVRWCGNYQKNPGVNEYVPEVSENIVRLSVSLYSVKCYGSVWFSNFVVLIVVAC